MVTKKKPGFGGQWVEAFGVGKQVGFTDDDEKVELEVTPDLLHSLAKNYDVNLHEAPACIGHPKADAPAYGWISDVRVNSDKLEIQFADTQPEFEDMVRRGLFKKRSLKLYLDPDDAPGGVAPNIRHCAFLGAQPPALKNLKNIHFNEDEGESVQFEIEGDIHFSEGETAVPLTDAEKKAAQEEVKKTAREAVTDFLKKTFGLGEADAVPATVAFSETDRAKLVEDAVAAAQLKFSEELKTRDTKIEELTKQVGEQGGSTKRAAILSFCENNLATVIPAFKSMGLVEFMETLDDSTAKNKVTVISFAEGDGKKEEKHELSQLGWFQDFIKSLPPFISFGEKFGELRLKGDGSAIVDPGQLDALREGMGVKKPQAAAAK